MIEAGEDYSKVSWLEWGKEKKAKAVPGALNFIKYAQSKGVDVYYVSNRLFEQKSETLENLQKTGFPYADAAHVLLRDNGSGKEPGRLQVQESHEIVLLIGDNLSDFSEVFDNQSTDVRNRRVDSLKTVFGNRFIVLPIPKKILFGIVK